MLSKSVTYIKSKLKHLKIFDWILILLGVVAIIIFAVLFFRKSTFITATIVIGEDSAIYTPWKIDTGPRAWFAHAFRVGQKEKSGLGKIQAEVLNVYSYNKDEEHKSVYLDVKLNTVYNPATNTYTYKGTPVLVGSQIKLILDNVYAEGLVTEVQGFPESIKKQKVVVETQLRDENATYLQSAGTEEYLADAVQKGDIIKDNKDEVLIKVLDKRVVPAAITVTTSSGKVVSGYDPLRKDVYFTLEITAEKIDGRYYFLNDIPIVIDRGIPINTETTIMYPTVTKFISY